MCILPLSFEIKKKIFRLKALPFLHKIINFENYENCTNMKFHSSLKHYLLIANKNATTSRIYFINIQIDRSSEDNQSL